MRPPWVGMPTRYDDEKDRFSQDRFYLDAVRSAGGVPVLIPVGGEKDLLDEYTPPPRRCLASRKPDRHRSGSLPARTA